MEKYPILLARQSSSNMKTNYKGTNGPLNVQINSLPATERLKSESSELDAMNP